MPNDAVYAPWRMEYIRGIDQPGNGGCFICQAAAAVDEQQRRQRLVLWSTAHSIVIINRYPYTSGHLLISPLAHKPQFEDLTTEELLDLQLQTVEAVRLLKRAMSPQGFNLGTNLGRCAGAGLPGHVHQHLVPRWNGDTNFMSVVGEVRIIPQAMSQLYDELLRVRAQMLAARASSPV